MCDHNEVINFDSTCDQVDASCPTYVDCSDTSFEGFRGFQKEPFVLIERFDITPYLTTESPVRSPPKPRIKWKIRPTKKPLLREDKTKRPHLKPSGKLVLNEPQVTTTGAVKIPASFVDRSSKLSVQVFRDDLKELKKVFIKSPQEFDDTIARIPRMSLRCNICEKLYSSEKKLHNHQENKHMIIYRPEKNKSQKRVSFSDKVIVHELKEYHKCRKCPKIFENYKVLKSHMKEQHKKRKCYICNYCSKKFVDRMFFKVHIKLHCDACGLLFSSKSKCIDHKRNICKTLKFHKCKTCNLNFYKLMDLKDHSYEHNSNTCFVCDICKDQCSSKCAVAHHIYFLHSKRQKSFNLSLYITKKIVRESLFLCRFCEESSVDRDLIEKHVELLPDLSNRAMTGYKDYYFCDQCLKQFDAESDMLQHKWTHFLKTSDNSQERTKSNPVKNTKLNTVYNVKDGIPDYFQPKIVLEKLKVSAQPMTGPEESVNPKTFDVTDGNIDVTDGNINVNDGNINVTDGSVDVTDGNIDVTDSNIDVTDSNIDVTDSNIDVTDGNIDVTDGNIDVTNGNIDVTNGNIIKPIVDPKSKKTLNSKHQCETCGKYYSSNYCLNRHIETQHSDYENLRCGVCEEVFVWPSLLRSHKCIRLQIPEMPFEDARPEIHFDNLHELGMANVANGGTELNNGFDDLNIDYSEDYLNSVDFEIPAPIVQLTEQQNTLIPAVQNGQMNPNPKVNALQSLGYKIVMQEVPIEF